MRLGHVFLWRPIRLPAGESGEHQEGAEGEGHTANEAPEGANAAEVAFFGIIHLE
jgi:hypothetical protein